MKVRVEKSRRKCHRNSAKLKVQQFLFDHPRPGKLSVLGIFLSARSRISQSFGPATERNSEIHSSRGWHRMRSSFAVFPDSSFIEINSDTKPRAQDRGNLIPKTIASTKLNYDTLKITTFLLKDRPFLASFRIY